MQILLKALTTSLLAMAKACQSHLVESHQLLLQGHVGSDGLYSFPGLLSSSSSLQPSSLPLVNTIVVSPKFHIWHSRLGHPHKDVLHSVLTSCNIHIPFKYLNEYCSACCLGKSHRLPTTLSTIVYSFPLELVYCDLWDLLHVFLLMEIDITCLLLMLIPGSPGSIFYKQNQKP